MMEPQISQICCRLRACYRTQDCQNILEITVQAQRAKPSTAKNTKNHKETQSTAQKGGPCVRVRRTSGPGACRGVAGFARHALVFEGI